MLELEGVQAFYGESHVLHGIHLRVDAGEIVTLVGRNGAGKTTTLKTIMGLVPPRSGTIVYDGTPLNGLRPDHIARRGIGYVPEERGIYASLSVAENLTLPPVIDSVRAWPLDRVHALFPVLKERAHMPGTTLSGGEQQMLAIARILRSGARLILLDEPTEGLAPSIVRIIGDVLLEIKKSGVTVLLVEQNLRFATRVADRHHLMVHGRIVERLSNDDAIAREADLLTHLGV